MIVFKCPTCRASMLAHDDYRNSRPEDCPMCDPCGLRTVVVPEESWEPSPLPWHVDPATGNLCDAFGVPIIYVVKKSDRDEPSQFRPVDERMANMRLIAEWVNKSLDAQPTAVKEGE